MPTPPPRPYSNMANFYPVADYSTPYRMLPTATTVPPLPPYTVPVFGETIWERLDEAVTNDQDAVKTTAYGAGYFFLVLDDFTPSSSTITFYVRSGGWECENVYAWLRLYESDGTTLVDELFLTGYNSAGTNSLETKSGTMDVSGADTTGMILRIDQDGFFTDPGGYVYTSQVYGEYNEGGGDGSFSHELSSTPLTTITSYTLGSISQSYPPEDAVDERFKYKDPITYEDAINGQICSLTGFWAPAHCITYIDGRPVISDFAKPSVERGPDLFDQIN